jgi:hypothetical protein
VVLAKPRFWSWVVEEQEVSGTVVVVAEEQSCIEPTSP